MNHNNYKNIILLLVNGANRSVATS